MPSSSLHLQSHIMDRNPLLSLSQELVLAICDELRFNDLKHMRLTCKTLADVVASLVLSKIIIQAEEVTKIEELLSDLRSITDPQRVAVNCTREITFRIFSTNHRECVGDLSRDLNAALTSLRLVRTVNWYTGRLDPLWLQEIIWDAIKEFPNLRHLMIDATFFKQQLWDFDSFNALESINISGGLFKDNNDALFLSLSKLYASSCKLNSITIDFQQAHGLQKWFSCKPKGILRHLAITSILFDYDKVALSHLANLTSFKLSLPDPPHLDCDIWAAFRQSGIRIEELEVKYYAITDSLSDYLSSFPGLKKLRLSIPNFDSQAYSEAHAVKFWSTGLPNHIETLHNFSLYSNYEGQWCFDDHSCPLIAKCTKLVQLAVSVLPGGEANWVSKLLDMVVNHIPCLKHLILHAPYQEKYRRTTCGTHRLRTKMYDTESLAHGVLNYRPPTSCQHLPQLIITDRPYEGTFRVFVGVGNVQRSRLSMRYLESVL